MSDTPKKADDCQKLLDNGWSILLYKNELGSYTADAMNRNDDNVVTDDFTPSQALYRLTEKVTTGRIA
jgi:hypothetical protein